MLQSLKTQTNDEWRTRTHNEAMRDHEFVGNGQYCNRMVDTGQAGSSETGFIKVQAGCGWTREYHPVGTQQEETE